MILGDNIDILHDKRVDCLSIITRINIDQYVSLVENAYDNRGGIKNQRDILKTTTAKRIRKRMIDDIISGAVLPPIVIGLVIEDNGDGIDNIKNERINREINNNKELSIIDGMQRTTAIIDAINSIDLLGMDQMKDLLNREIRIEFWISYSFQSLIYRMLILNTGQIPWDIKRQLKVVYDSMIEELRKNININIIDDEKYRNKPGYYSSDSIAELYIAFGLRKTDVKKQEIIANDFANLDISDSLSKNYYNDIFYPTIKMMYDIDISFSKLDYKDNIFNSNNTRIGFVVAIANEIIGRIGSKREGDYKYKLENILYNHYKFVVKLRSMSKDNLEDFLKLDVLNEVLYDRNRARSGYGRQQQSFFYEAFKILISENFEVEDMEVCWRY